MNINNEVLKTIAESVLRFNNPGMYSHLNMPGNYAGIDQWNEKVQLLIPTIETTLKFLWVEVEDFVNNPEDYNYCLLYKQDYKDAYCFEVGNPYDEYGNPTNGVTHYMLLKRPK